MSNQRGDDPGRYNKKLSIYRYTEIRDALNQRKTVLKKLRTVWAELVPVRGTEFLESYKDANQLQYKIHCRYIKGLTEKDVLVYKDRQFEITSIINISEANVTLEIYCTEWKDKKVLYE